MGRPRGVTVVRPEASEVEWAYLAGIIDGEGCLGAHRAPNGRQRPNLSIVQKYPAVLYWVEKTFGGYLHQKPARYTWRVTGGRFQGIIEGALPYLTLKHPQAVVALAMMEAETERSLELYKTLSKLKRMDVQKAKGQHGKPVRKRRGRS